MKLYGRGATIAILLIFLLSNVASAYYIPAEYQGEAKAIKTDIQVYQFAVQHQDQRWAFDILRQLAQNYTNGGYIAQLHIEMKKYLKVGG
jgi:hypothetical protein